MRSKFDPGATYAGRLQRVSQRPIEKRDSPVSLLRLEFLIFRIDGSRLETKGQIASRDLILWPGMEGDSGIQRLADALRVRPALSVQAWVDAAGRRPWMTIQFREPSSADQRQPFDEIGQFDPDAEGLALREVPHDKGGSWASVQAAATELDLSTSTVRRLIDSHKEEFGEVLVRRTVGAIAGSI